MKGDIGMANYEKQVEQEAAYPIPISLYNCYRTVRHEKRYREFIIIDFYNIISEPFVVGFVETTYTVDESVGAVTVCVNLTRPMIDILDERVNVFVIDNSSSVYIPPGAPLASES